MWSRAVEFGDGMEFIYLLLMRNLRKDMDGFLMPLNGVDYRGRSRLFIEIVYSWGILSRLNYC